MDTKFFFTTEIGTLALAGCTTGFSRFFAPGCNYRKNMRNNEIREIEAQERLGLEHGFHGKRGKKKRNMDTKFFSTTENTERISGTQISRDNADLNSKIKEIITISVQYLSTTSPSGHLAIWLKKKETK